MNILVIDNSSVFLEILKDIFSNSGLTPIICSNAEEAVSTLKSQQVDFICASLHLEDISGIELTRSIRMLPTYKHTPILLFTSEESSDTYFQALSSGVTEVFHKKDVSQLAHFIRRFMVQQQPLSGRILYVEDMASQRNILTASLTEKGLDVDAFSTAEQAWQSYLNNEYDLVITDIMLEGKMTGMAFANRIRRLDNEKGDIPVLAITGFDDISRRIELFYLGINDYVIKPVISEELIARVKNLINSKNVYTETLQQRKRAELADAAKSQFIAQMSHELGTPLNAIIGFSNLLLSDTSLPEQYLDEITEINHAGKHLNTLVNDLKDLSKIEAGEVSLEITSTPLAYAVKRAISQIMPLANQQQVEVKPYTISENISVQADRRRLQQILLNILSNAIKYNHHGGSIEILLDSKSTNLIRLGIKDSGIGISEELQSQLFVPFKRADQTAHIEGTGLGLVISQQLILAMNGKIELKSKPNHGTTVWVELPVH